MTCIVGLEHEGKVFIGGDSAASDGYHLNVRTDEKVFINGPFIMGFTTSFRMGQILRYCFVPPEQSVNENDDMKFLVKDFIGSIRECFKNNGFQPKSATDSQSDYGGTFLFGYRGKLYTVEDDFQVAKMQRKFTACGCGQDVALGSLYTTEGDTKISPEERLIKALNTSAHFSCGVLAPFVVKNI